MGNFPFLGLSGRVGSFPHAFDGHGPSEERRRIVRKAPEELVQPRHRWSWAACVSSGCRFPTNRGASSALVTEATHARLDKTACLVA